MSNVGDNERLMVLVEARITDLERNMRRASQVTGQNFGRMRQDARSATRAMEADVVRSTTRINQAIAATSTRIGALAATYAGGRGMGGSLGGVAGAIGAFLSVQSASRLSDSATQITNALKVAGLEGQKLTEVYNQLFEAAQRNSAPLESLVTLYGRAAVVQNELGVSSEELLSFTNNVALALRVAGTDATTASGSLLQLSQALGAGTVRAEEFNSILEGALPIAQAAAAGIEEAGGSVARLRALVVEGKISSEAFFRGFEAGAVILEDKVAGAESTVSQAFVRLMNVLTDTAGKLNEGTGASEDMSDALDDLGAWVAATDFSPLISGVLDFAGAIGQTIEAVHALGGALGELTGTAAFGDYVRLQRGRRRADEAVGRAFEDGGQGVVGNLAGHGDGSGAASGTQRAILAAALRQQAGGITNEVAVARTVTPISIADYAAPSASGGGGGGRARGGGGGRRGGGGGGGATRLNDFERETKQIRDRTAAIIAETRAMEGLNPTVDDYGHALEKARAAHDLMTAAQEAGLTVTPELKGQIDQLAEGYANASAEANKLADAQDAARQQADEMRALGEDVFKGFVSDMRQGISAADALSNALGKIADKLIDMAITGLFAGGEGDKKGGGGGGLFGSIFGSLFGGGRAKGGTVRGDKIYEIGERGPELFAPGQAGTIIPNHNLPTGGGGTTVNVKVINNAGAEVRTQERREPDGTTSIEVMVDKMVAQKMGQRGSETNNALRQGFGAQPTLRRR